MTNRKTDKNNCIVNAVKIAFIAKNIVPVPFYSHGAKMAFNDGLEIPNDDFDDIEDG